MTFLTIFITVTLIAALIIGAITKAFKRPPPPIILTLSTTSNPGAPPDQPPPGATPG